MYKTKYQSTEIMKKTMNRLAATFLACLLIAGSGCVTGPSNPANKPPRKKMDSAPLRDNGGWDSFSLVTSDKTPALPQYLPMPFTMTDTLLAFNGTSADFYIVRAPSSNFDFLLPMAKVYEPYLSAYLGSWTQTGRQGIAIDVSAGNAALRSSFQLESEDHHVSIPVVLFYDMASTGRVENLIKTIRSLSTLHSDQLENGVKNSF